MFLILFLFLASPIRAQETVTIYFFYSKNCPHCAEEKPFLKKMVEKYHPVLEVKSYEVSNSENLEILKKTIQAYDAKVPAGAVPFTAVGEHYFLGWLDEQTTGQQIEEAIRCSINNGCTDVVSQALNNQKSKTSQKNHIVPNSLKLPFVGQVETKNLSLPVLTVLIGVLDGFNPCAMWTLLFLISLLLGMKNRTRMWILGIAFILTSGLVYFALMSLWLNMFLFLGMVAWVRTIIGLVALGAAGWNLYSWWKNKDSGCDVVDDKKRKNVFEKIKKITHKRSFWLALGGIVLLALAVNVVELACSAGLPAIYTQILALNNLSTFKYYLYIGLYIFFFMVDDLVVFFVAMTTLKMVGIESKYARISKLIGGSLMLLIGLLLIFKPEVLMFS